MFTLILYFTNSAANNGVSGFEMIKTPKNDLDLTYISLSSSLPSPKCTVQFHLKTDTNTDIQIKNL